MTLPLSTLRHALRQPLANPRLLQRRWARVHDVRYLATHDAQERIMAKYREKLERRAKEQGLSDVSELKDVYKDKINQLRKQAIVPGATGPLTPPPSPELAAQEATNTTPDASQNPQKSPWPSPPPPPPPPPPPSPQSKSTPKSAGAPPPGVKTLSSFLDVPKLQPLPEKEIQALWRLRHASNPQSVHFVVPAHTFSQLLETAKQHPSFVLPMPREIPKEGSEPEAGETQQAAELHYLQFTHPHVHTTTLLFTSLAEFKLRGEYASPHTTITFHQELAASHNLVLGQGVVTEGRGVSVDEARWLLMCMQKFYVQSEEGKGRGELLNMFTKGDAGFKVERLIDEAEKIL